MKRSYYVVNSITLYRVLAAPFLFYLIFTNRLELFRWFLGVSFLTDAVDGFLARKFKVESNLGSRLDSIGDDLTMAAAVTGLFFFKWDFVEHEFAIIITLLSLFSLQFILALFRYGKTTSFHTYLAKTSAVCQGFFLLATFFFEEPSYAFFYITAIMTFFDLVEEIILVILLPVWTANVKGLYWVLRNRTNTSDQ